MEQQAILSSLLVILGILFTTHFTYVVNFIAYILNLITLQCSGEGKNDFRNQYD
jgi:hypothetical protein